MKIQYRTAWCLASIGIAGIAMPLQAQVIRELVCRGGSSGLQFRVTADPSPESPEAPKMVRMAMQYAVSLNYKSGNPLTLSPGTCGWDTAFAAPRPPGEVRFDIEANAQSTQARMGQSRDTSVKAAAVYPDTASIRRYLSVSNQYWVFYVDEGEEHFSNSFGPSEPDLSALAAGSVRDASTTVEGAAAPPRSKDGTLTLGQARTRPDPTTSKVGERPKTIDVARAMLQFVKVVALPEHFNIQFTARPHASPTVVYNLSEPIQEPSTGRWFFQKPLPTTVTEGTTSSPIKAAYLAMPRAPLIRGGTPYYFIISVPASGKDFPFQQYQGSFNTMSLTARVVFTGLDVLNDSDKNSAGDLQFDFKVFAGDAIDGPITSSVYGSWESNTSVDLKALSLTDRLNGTASSEGVVLEYENAPDKIRVLVWGYDDDGEPTSEGFHDTPNWNVTGGSNPGGDWNVAKREFDLHTTRPDGSFLAPFTLRSHDGDVLMFEVHGYVEVIRK